MKLYLFPFLWTIFVFFCGCNMPSGQGLYEKELAKLELNTPVVPLKYPESKKGSFIDHYPGRDQPDPYQWLEAEDSSVAILDWKQRQLAWTQNYLQGIGSSAKILARLIQLATIEEREAPFRIEAYDYYLQKSALDSQWQLLKVDTNQTSNAFSHVIASFPSYLQRKDIFISESSFSSKGSHLALGIKDSDSKSYNILILQLKDKGQLTQKLEDLSSPWVAWYEDGFYYCKKDKDDFPLIQYHSLGKKPSQDKLVFRDPTQKLDYLKLSISSDERWLFLNSKGPKGSNLYIRPLFKAKSQFECILKNVAFDFDIVSSSASRLFIKSNYQNNNYQLLNINLENPALKNWQLVVDPTEDETLMAARQIGERLLVLFEKDYRQFMRVYDLRGSLVGLLPFPDLYGLGSPVTIEGIRGNASSNQGYYRIHSFLLAPNICEFDIQSRETDIWHSPDLAYDPSLYVTEQVFLDSIQRIPLYLIHKKGLENDSSNACLLISTAGNKHSNLPHFKPEYLPFLEQGGILAYAPNSLPFPKEKEKVLENFLKASQYLLEKGYTKSTRFAITSSSSMSWVAAMATMQKPENYALVLLGAGPYDLLRQEQISKQPSLWGNAKDSTQCAHLFRFSPLHQTDARTSYPKVFFQLDAQEKLSAHAYKLLAQLQSLNNDASFPKFLNIYPSNCYPSAMPSKKELEGPLMDRLILLLLL